ncbi:hypothetical protein [Secundilactobacillus similis]|uniref:Uncharacterized protein n=1 Tax=Secundilactobacillus similis DSM 23365 = JCM 2765 TaxID=1423804 RepID=A0A0R2FBX8_9LACO|nr:hypothetical protein [Secundilactobacillus similis]KRN25986.1 hypothetical protein FD14_GL000092 [Secundilactobacillus similis DSM 23365 = JCM 2765]
MDRQELFQEFQHAISIASEKKGNQLNDALANTVKQLKATSLDDDTITAIVTSFSEMLKVNNAYLNQVIYEAFNLVLKTDDADHPAE